jgi:hypothetical protein
MKPILIQNELGEYGITDGKGGMKELEGEIKWKAKN